MASLPPGARFFAVGVTALAVVSVPAISGASGLRLVHGTNGDDTIITKAHAQRVMALAGDDYVRLGSSNDVAYGDKGNDWLHGNDGRDRVYGGPGRDHPQGGGGADRVY